MQQTYNSLLQNLNIYNVIQKNKLSFYFDWRVRNKIKVLNVNLVVSWNVGIKCKSLNTTNDVKYFNQMRECLGLFRISYAIYEKKKCLAQTIQLQTLVCLRSFVAEKLPL